MREFEFIEWIRSQGAADAAAVPVGPGDDCAVVACGSERVLVTVDQVLDGVHFVLSDHGARAAGRKALARNLSDIAAMAAAPMGAVASVALPRGMQRADAEEIYHGLRDVGDEFGCPVVGGDVGSWDGALAISVTVFGRPGGIEPVLRSGATPGDAICVTGAFGGAWRTERHLTFTPRVREARDLADGYDLHAMIDVSDGLAADLAHLCTASSVGAEILAADVPVHPDAVGLDAALGDGEDYELLFTLPVEQASRVTADQPLDVPVTRVGTVTAESARTLVHPDGRREELKATGWEHEA